MQTIKDMTDEELMAIAGDEAGTDISQVSDDELMKIADVQPQKPLRKADLLDQVLPRPIAENLGLVMRGLPNRGPAQFEQGDLNLLGDIVDRPAKAIGGFIAPKKGESRVDAYIRGSVDPGSVDSFVEKSQGSQVFSDPKTPVALQFAAGYARDLAGFGIDVATNPSNYIPVGMIAKNLNVAAKQVTGIFGKRPGMIVVPRTEIAKPAARMLSAEFMPMTPDGVVDQAIDIGIVKGVRPSVSGKQGMGDVVRYKNQARDAVKTIVENKNDLLLEDYAGNLTKKLPETVNEFAQSIGQTKSLVYKEYSNLIKEAGENNAVVALDPVVAEMQKIATNKSLLMKDPEIAKYAAGVAERFQGVGKMGPDEADDLVTLYNQSLKAFYSNPTYESASKAAIDAMVVNKLRKSLDETVEGATGEAFQVLKNKYGALKAIEKDVVNRAIVAGRQNVKGLIDFSDIFSAGDVVNGILSMRPELIAKGVAQNQVKNYWRKLNSPDRQIATMFRTVDRNHVAVPRSVRRTAEVVEDSPVEPFLPKITDQGGKPRLPGGGVTGLPDKTPTPGSFRMLKGEPVQTPSQPLPAGYPNPSLKLPTTRTGERIPNEPVNKSKAAEDILRNRWNEKGSMSFNPIKGGEKNIYYRGNMADGRKGNYFTKDKEFARNFTQSGKDSEISQHIIPGEKIYSPEILPSANSEKEMNIAISEAKKKGFGALEVSEGRGQPNSIFVIDRSILNNGKGSMSFNPIKGGKTVYHATPTKNVDSIRKSGIKDGMVTDTKADAEEYAQMLRNRGEKDVTVMELQIPEENLSSRGVVNTVSGKRIGERFNVVERQAAQKGGGAVKALTPLAIPAAGAAGLSAYGAIRPGEAEAKGDKFDTILKRTLGFEGGFTVDHAGPTNHGITQDTYDAYRKGKGLIKKPVTKINGEEVKDLYYSRFFKSPGFDKLPENIAAVAFDYGVNAGTSRAVRAVQKAVGVVADGKIGPKTLAAISKADQRSIIESILDDRERHFNYLVETNPKKYGKYKNGWANRIKRLREEFL